MSSAALIAIAAEIGAPIVRSILSKKIGSKNAGLATDVIEAVATRMGVPAAGVEEAVQRYPEEAREAVQEVERMAPEMVQLYAVGVEGQFALLQAEMKKPLWTWAWRPLGMYGVGFLWFWNVIILHSINALFKTALPPVDLVILLQLTGLYMTLYMGGHTLKEAVHSWKGNR